MNEDASNDSGDVAITELASEYLCAVGTAEAKREEILAGWGEENYQPGDLSSKEWELVKTLLGAGDNEHVLMEMEIAAYRKAATELDCEDEFDDNWGN